LASSIQIGLLNPAYNNMANLHNNEGITIRVMTHPLLLM